MIYMVGVTGFEPATPTTLLNSNALWLFVVWLTGDINIHAKAGRNLLVT